VTYLSAPYTRNDFEFQLMRADATRSQSRDISDHILRIDHVDTTYITYTNSISTQWSS